MSASRPANGCSSWATTATSSAGPTSIIFDGIYELRWRNGRVQHRILYFFHGRTAVVLVHALSKEAAIRAADLTRAKQRKANFDDNPTTHTHVGDLSHG